MNPYNKPTDNRKSSANSHKSMSVNRQKIAPGSQCNKLGSHSVSIKNPLDRLRIDAYKVSCCNKNPCNSKHVTTFTLADIPPPVVKESVSSLPVNPRPKSAPRRISSTSFIPPQLPVRPASVTNLYTQSMGPEQERKKSLTPKETKWGLMKEAEKSNRHKSALWAYPNSCQKMLGIVRTLNWRRYSAKVKDVKSSVDLSVSGNNVMSPAARGCQVVPISCEPDSTISPATHSPGVVSNDTSSVNGEVNKTTSSLLETSDGVLPDAGMADLTSTRPSTADSTAWYKVTEWQLLSDTASLPLPVDEDEDKMHYSETTNDILNYYIAKDGINKKGCIRSKQRILAKASDTVLETNDTNSFVTAKDRLQRLSARLNSGPGNVHVRVVQSRPNSRATTSNNCKFNSLYTKCTGGDSSLYAKSLMYKKSGAHSGYVNIHKPVHLLPKFRFAPTPLPSSFKRKPGSASVTGSDVTYTTMDGNAELESFYNAVRSLNIVGKSVIIPS